MVNEFKVGDEVRSDAWPAGKVLKYEPETGYYLVDVGGVEVWSHKKALRLLKQHTHQFQVGDKVAHEEHGNGEVKESNGFLLWCWFDSLMPAGRYCRRDELRPRNFLSKIAEERDISPAIDVVADQFVKINESLDRREQVIMVSGTRSDGFPACAVQTFEERENKEKLVDQIYQNSIDKICADTNRGNDDRFQKNAYGQLVDTVTGLPADSDGIVKITSIRDSVREIS